jgi:hypothetical protein
MKKKLIVVAVLIFLTNIILEVNTLAEDELPNPKVVEEK